MHASTPTRSKPTCTGFGRRWNLTHAQVASFTAKRVDTASRPEQDFAPRSRAICPSDAATQRVGKPVIGLPRSAEHPIVSPLLSRGSVDLLQGYSPRDCVEYCNGCPLPGGLSRTWAVSSTTPPIFQGIVASPTRNADLPGRGAKPPFATGTGPSHSLSQEFVPTRDLIYARAPRSWA
jgi:hypothetical protein